MCHQVNSGSGQHSHRADNPTGHHGDCCCGHNRAPRRFPTKEEIREELKEYLKQLKAETRGVEEKLAELGEG